MIISKKIILTKKNFVFIWMLLFIAFGLRLNAMTSQDLESLTAFLRIPAVVGANTLGKQPGTTPKIIVIASDLLRLSNEILSIFNKHGRYDFHVYDFCWGAYDVKNLIKHVKNFGGDKNNKIEKTGSEEFKKLESKIQALHELILPLVEGVSAFLQSESRTNNLRNEGFRNRCRAICSLSRLVDNLILSETKSTERYAYIILILANIVAAIAIDGIVGIAIVEQNFRDREDRLAERVARYLRGEGIREDGLGDVGVRAVAPVVPDDTDEEYFRNIGGQIEAKDHSADPVIVNDKTFTDGGCTLCLSPFVPGEGARRLVCGHLIHNCSKNGHEDCFGQFTKQTGQTTESGIAAVCPVCKGKRDEGRETDITIEKK